MRQNIKRLIVSTKVFYIELLLYRYLSHFIIRNFAPVIQEDCNKFCELAYKVD